MFYLGFSFGDLGTARGAPIEVLSWSTYCWKGSLDEEKRRGIRWFGACVILLSFGVVGLRMSLLPGLL